MIRTTKGETANGRLLLVTQSGPWEGEHKGRWWTLDGEDVAALATEIRRGASERQLLAVLNVPKANHPKALRCRSLLSDAGVAWPSRTA